MEQNPESIAIKIARRRLLKQLDILYPTPVQLETLYRSLTYIDSKYDSVQFKKDIAYLKAKGWIEYVKEKIGRAPTFAERIVRLTASGKEIAERTRIDNALEIFDE